MVSIFTSGCCTSRLARGNAQERTHSETSSNYLCANDGAPLRADCGTLAGPGRGALGARRAVRRRSYRRATAILDVVVTSDLPDDIKKIVKSLAGWARGYNNRLKWNEEAKLSDMMEVPERWTPERAPVDAVKAACLEAGMTEQDTKTIVDFLRKRQAGNGWCPRGLTRASGSRPLSNETGRPRGEARAGRVTIQMWARSTWFPYARAASRSSALMRRHPPHGALAQVLAPSSRHR